MFPCERNTVGSSAVGIGLLGGMVAERFWPQTPLYAVATDRIDTFGMATGPVDDEVEAVYFLDFLTGDLKRPWCSGNSRAPGPASSANVAADLGVDPQKSPST